MADFLLALAQGTTSSRAIVFDPGGQPVAVAQQEFEQFFPRPGEVEHAPGQIWSSQYEVAQQAITEARLSPADIAAIGVTNQRETTLLWDRASGEPVSRSIVWQSRVSAPICDRLRAEGLEATVREKTGLVIDAYFSATKIMHLLERDDDLRRRAQRGEVLFGTVDSWLLWKLTGGTVHATDPSNASRTMLFNIHRCVWDDELLSAFNIPREMLPEVLPSSHVYGETVPELFGAPIPIGGVAGDQQAATFGQACFTAGMAKNTYGTGCFLLLNTGQEAVPSQHRMLTTIGWQIGDQVTYCLEGAIFVAGSAVQWLRDGLGMFDSVEQFVRLAESVDDTDGVVFIPALTGLGAPHWDAYARGTLLGLTRGTKPAHIALATLQAVALQTYDLVGAMQNDAGIELTQLRTDGGMAVNNQLMQMQANLLGVPVERATVAETTALGAAYLAGLAVGVWPDLADLSQQWSAGRSFTPSGDESSNKELISRWHRGIERSLDWARE